VLTVTNPMDFGAAGDGVADDLPSLEAAIEALPAGGGIVYLPSGKSFRKNDLLSARRLESWSGKRVNSAQPLAIRWIDVSNPATNRNTALLTISAHEWH
jgi:hypothetical protein